MRRVITTLGQIARLAFAMIAAVVIALAIWGYTSGPILMTLGGPAFCDGDWGGGSVEGAGFNILTGQPHGRIVRCPGKPPVEGALPDALVGRWAVPLPIGFAIGTAIGAIFLVATRRPTVPTE